MSKEKRSAEEQVADEANRKALNPTRGEAEDFGRPSRSGIPEKPRAPQSRAAGTRGRGAEGEGQMIGPLPAGRPWTVADDRQLHELLKSGMKAALIARTMNRTVGAIQSRKSLLKAKKT
jgi:hypothetical protein